MISVLLDQYLLDNGYTYQTLNDCTGALDNARSEFYRRKIVPFEEEKKQKNGDVYSLDVV